MGFRKGASPPDVQIVVEHKWHPGTQFVFTFPKVLPQAAADAERAFIALKDEERADAYRRALVGVVAEMVTAEPEGFDDFPTGNVTGSLADRMRGYFDDPDRPELEQIIVGAWRAYKAAAVTAAYVKSLSVGGAPGSQPSGVPGATAP